ncbi:MAG: hypothetical protein SFX72_02950 [Isosphaeraceae bacterium]|nr:hypothetical protein [Isosphaeraceae bacterium]
MSDTKEIARTETSSYARLVQPLPAILLLVAALIVRPYLDRRPVPPRASVAVVPPTPIPVAVPEPEPPQAPEPAKAPPIAPAPPPSINRVEVAKAQNRLDDARRAADAARRTHADLEADLDEVKDQLDRDSALLLTLEEQARLVAHRIGYAQAEGARAQADRNRLQGEVAALAKKAKPRPTALLDKTPVARAVQGDEVHFEVRRERVTPIALDRLVELVKTDAQLRMKVSGARTRPVIATVGPVGEFALKYELGLMVAGLGSSALEVSAVGYGLRGWELVPVSDERGETLDEVVRPGSAYARAVLALSPGKTSVTFWVYPDGFALYRRLRDDLHARGYLVAARPLPEGLPIQASPSGSASAAQ